MTKSLLVAIILIGISWGAIVVNHFLPQPNLFVSGAGAVFALAGVFVSVVNLWKFWHE